MTTEQDNTPIDPWAGYAMFDQIVGQERNKRQFKFYIDGYRKTNRMPNLLMVAARGTGKNLFTDAIAENLVPRDSKDGARKGKLLINCSTIKSVKMFWDHVVTPYLQHADKHFTIIMDECHTLSDDVTSMFLTILNPNRSNENVFSYQNMKVSFSFFRHTFIFLTTEGHRVFHALADRLERVEIGDYTQSDLAEIIRRYLEVGFDDTDILNQVAEVVRVNPRNAVKMAEKIKSYCNIHDKDTFSMEDWGNLKEALDIKPYGLTELEMQYLSLLQERKPIRLGILASRLSLTPKALQGDLEVYLNKMGLIENSVDGRQITDKGFLVVKPDGKPVTSTSEQTLT